MKKSILITGVPGTGKSALSTKLKAMGYKAYDMEQEPGLFAMIHQKTKQPIIDHDNANLEKVMEMDWICNKEKLVSIIAQESHQLAFYCGSASNIDEILQFFDMVILLKLNSEVARQRLTTRTEKDFGKTKEVQDWIMSWKSWWENSIQEKGAIVINAERNLDEVVGEVIKVVATS